MTDPVLAQRLCDFIQQAPSPFHAVRQMTQALEGAGFVHLADSANWQVEPGGRYFFTRNDSALIALQLGTAALSDSGIRMVGTHTDSPCLKIKPNPEVHKLGYLQLGVEVYGGALLNPWFDRDLSIAGRVSYLNSSNKLDSALLDFKAPVAFIPSLAIHLDREVNLKRSINSQTDLPPLLMQTGASTTDFRTILRTQLLQQDSALDVVKVLDYELCLYDTNPPALIGLHQEFVAGARLDNLLSCFTAMHALLNSSGTASKLLVCTDHEEVGSASAAGASGPFLESVLLRLTDLMAQGSQQQHQRMLTNSMLVSVDNAHAIHPNFADKHDGKHGPLMNAGPVIKYNANQRYATNSNTAARFKRWCEASKVPVQSFVVRSDMACGSTIGPVIATELGIETLDIGVPTLGMHSIREMAGSLDIDYLDKVLTHYYSSVD